MGRVHEIVLDNFKSYQGRVQVGPFRKFTCVIGPNGAGKSNLMDAISFVLGVQARQLRSERLRDLVYRTEKEDPKKNQRIASVELIYKDDDEEGGESTLAFKRLILKTGEARFQVNGETMSQADYDKRLRGINILSKVRNFLVFQGDVEATAQRQGKDLTAFFEQISGSEALRPEYERLAAEKTKREDNARYLFTKKRNAINEKKRVAQQKDEADDYVRLEGERRNLQREFCLFRLHGIARQLEESGAMQGEAMVAQERLRGAVEEGRQSLEGAERERAQAHLATGQAERALAAARAKLEKLNPECVAAKNKLAFLRLRMEELSQNAEKDTRKKANFEEQLQTLRQEQGKLEVAEREVAERVAQRELRFTPEQREEFERVKRETEKITAASGDSVRQIEHQLRAVVAERAQADGDLRETQARRDGLRRKGGELAEAEQAARAALQRETELAQQRGAELENRRGSATSCAEEKEELQKERQQLLDTIQDITATEKQLEREREVSQVCSKLAEAVPGVHGRVIDLCSPSQRRLHVAVNVALGKFLDAVVVDTSETARACVRYLKEHMYPPMTFLPLGDLRVAPLDPRLQELANGQRSLRLGLNCLSFDERFARAFEFVLGDVVVADTMADGRRLAFGDAKALGLSCKVVTLAGEAIAKNGNLSVNSEATKEGATRFDLSELEATKLRLENIDRRLYQIHSLESAGGADMAALQEEVRRAEAKASEASVRLKWCQEQLGQKGAELRLAEAALEGLQPNAARLAGEEAQLREELRGLEARASEAVAGNFAHLSAAMGVEDVRKVEREWRREQEAAKAKGDELARQLRNVKAEATMLEETLKERASTAPEELKQKIVAEIEQLSKHNEALSRSSEVQDVELKGSEERCKVCSETEREKEKAVSRLRLQTKETRQQLMAVEKRLADIGSEGQVLKDMRTDILRQSVLEDIEVPLLGAGVEALQDLAEEASQPASAPTQRPQAGQSSADIAIDFNALPQEKQAASAGPAAKMLEEEYRAELERLRVELERLSPNLKAIDQMQGMVENVQSASHEADAARREIEDIDTQFEAVRKARKEQFLDCFKKVSGEIGNVYRRLTANTAGLQADGGSAYLDLEDTEDPFNGGIKFTAMPPAKRFRDMHLLSGGEKTLAAMALLFAVHAYQRPPFMVLDEVDAALDANNVRALAAYTEQAECQTIVISLKDRFYVRGEALVGVWKNKPQETSAILTLDLTRYSPSAQPV